MNLRDSTMYVYAYGSAGYLDTVVRACADLGMMPHGEDFWQRADPAGTVEAVRLHSGSSQAVLVCRSGTSWTALREEWPALPVDGRVGEVHLFYAVYAGPPADRQVVRDAVATQFGGSAGAAELAVPWPGAYLWELGTGPGRVFILVGPLQTWQSMERWIWPAGRTLPAPLPAVLWQAARLRQEARTFGHDRPGMQVRQAALRRQVVALLAAGPAGRTEPLPEEDMFRLQWDTAHVAADEALLRARAVTVGAIRAEFDAADPDQRDDRGPLADDADLGRWLALEISDLADSAQAAVAFAEPVARAVQAGDARLTRILTERTQYYVTVQAAAIGALLVVLATVQSISYRWPTAEYLKLPVTAVLGLLSLVVPIWAAWRPTAAAPDRRTPRWLAAPAIAAAAATAWLGVTAAGHVMTGHPAPAWLSGAAAGLAAAAALLWMAKRRLRPS